MKILLFFNLILLKLIDNEKLLDYFKMAKNSYEDFDLPNILFKIKTESKMILKIYKYEKNIVVSIKGTTPQIFGINFGSTSIDDKKHDKLLFSCFKNKSKTVKKFHKLKFLEDGEYLINQIKKIYKTKNIIFIGHSLGGAIASIIAAKFNLKAYAFSSPGEKNIFKALKIKDKSKKVIHIGICNDSIYRGFCNGNLSLCKLASYEIETKCHLGRSFCLEMPGPFNLLVHSTVILEQLLEIGVIFKEITNENCRDCE